MLALAGRERISKQAGLYRWPGSDTTNPSGSDTRLFLYMQPDRMAVERVVNWQQPVLGQGHDYYGCQCLHFTD